MKRIIASAVLLVAGLFAMPPAAHANPQMACKAVLCLAAGSPPSECSDALKAFFDIKVWATMGLDIRKTIKARQGFLEMCDTGEYSWMAKSFANGETYCDSNRVAGMLNSAYYPSDGEVDSFRVHTANKVYGECKGWAEDYQIVNGKLELPVQQEVCANIFTGDPDDERIDHIYVKQPDGSYKAVKKTRNVCVTRYAEEGDTNGICRMARTAVSRLADSWERVDYSSFKISKTGQRCPT